MTEGKGLTVSLCCTRKKGARWRVVPEDNVTEPPFAPAHGNQ